MKVLAVDDENLALKALIKSIETAEPTAEIAGFRNPEEAFTYLKENPVDVAFLDIQMRGVSGIDVAREIKLRYPKTNIVFTTGFSEYQQEAFKMHASGYVMKPVNAEKIKEELENLRYPIAQDSGKKVRIQAFGNFEIYLDGQPIRFKYDKTKEMIAYLVDRNGTMCTTGEIMGILWEDDSHSSYFSNIRADLLRILEENNIEEILCKQRGKLGINRDKVDCDLFDWLDGKPTGINAFHGEYMSQYSWCEFAMSMFFD